ncbi:MAG: D-cysteine desulfhydrase family protein [Acidobacteria bacterium]|nr:D-cysteine desulfhydrase family protein [Acidobacteriota bacterium]
MKISNALATEPMRTLKEIPRLAMGFYPTPIEELPRLREALGKNAPRLFIKRDDYTGPGFGGNKVRKLEYVLAQALADEVEVVITIGGIKSNHCRATAAFCARLGLRCILVLNSPAAPSYKPANLFLDELYGAEVHLVTSREERKATMARLAQELRESGVRVAAIPLGASTPLGALGFVSAMQELAQQLSSFADKPNYIFHASSSCGTQAGIVAGAQLAGLSDIKIAGVSPDEAASTIAPEVAEIIRGIGRILKTEIPHEPILVLDDYIGEGYGISTPESSAALRLVAKTEGVVLDPTYTAKAMAGLLDWIRTGKLTRDDTVLFWHTGGQLALFAAH